MVNKPLVTKAQVLKVLEMCDVLTAEPVQLLFNGKTHYTTICGSVLSVVFFLICAIVTIVLSASDGRISNVIVNQVLQKEYYGGKRNEKHVKMSEGFNAAFGLTMDSDAIDLETVSEYGSLEVYFEGKKLDVEPCD